MEQETLSIKQLIQELEKIENKDSLVYVSQVLPIGHVDLNIVNVQIVKGKVFINCIEQV